MKIILAILCGLMVLFAGGCALILLSGAGYSGMFQSAPGAAIMGGIAALNVLVLIALFGTSKPQRWAFYVLAVLDVIAVVALGMIWLEFGFNDSGTNVLGGLLCGGFALKAILTLVQARRVS